MASRRDELFLKGESMGSPISRLAIRLPEKMRVMQENQQDRGCFRENAKAPAKRERNFNKF